MLTRHYNDIDIFRMFKSLIIHGSRDERVKFEDFTSTTKRRVESIFMQHFCDGVILFLILTIHSK